MVGKTYSEGKITIQLDLEAGGFFRAGCLGL